MGRPTVIQPGLNWEWKARGLGGCLLLAGLGSHILLSDWCMGTCCLMEDAWLMILALSMIFNASGSTHTANLRENRLVWVILRAYRIILYDSHDIAALVEYSLLSKSFSWCFTVSKGSQFLLFTFFVAQFILQLLYLLVLVSQFFLLKVALYLHFLLCRPQIRLSKLQICIFLLHHLLVFIWFLNYLETQLPYLCLKVTSLRIKCICSDSCDLLILPQKPQLRVKVMDLVERRLPSNLSLLYTNLHLFLLLKQNPENSDIGVYVLRYVLHFRIVWRLWGWWWYWWTASISYWDWLRMMGAISRRSLLSWTLPENRRIRASIITRGIWRLTTN